MIPPSDSLAIAEWCADGPGVVKVRAGATIVPADPNAVDKGFGYPNLYLLADDEPLVYAVSFDFGNSD